VRRCNLFCNICVAFASFTNNRHVELKKGLVKVERNSVGIVGVQGHHKIAANGQGLALLGDLENVRPELKLMRC